ncbi:MAG: serine/threonine protein kinase [Candidatus Riflebacteria bacterium]|nr:serine/threonine protein kinase [Candidatus Riflebacteria bacterium]
MTSTQGRGPGEPEQIGAYRIVRRIGTGGTGAVYEAVRPDARTPFALKVLKQELCRDPSVVHRFKREAALLSSIAHPGIVPVLESGDDRGTYYIIMPLVTNPTLAARLAGAGPVAVPGPDTSLIKVMISILMTLDAIHQKGVVHRDLTPGNIFLKGATEALLADFGIVKILGSESLLTQSGALVGTIPYMAPEQLNGEPVSPRTDVYQVGLLLYQVVAGRLPFERTLVDAVRAKCLLSALPDPRELGARVTDRMTRVIGKATAKTPGDRYAGALDMAASLERAVAG